MKRQTWFQKVMMAGTALTITLEAATIAHASQFTPTHSTGAPAPARLITPDRTTLPGVPSEVLVLTKAGISDTLIRSYIRESTTPYTLSARQIIFLRNSGVAPDLLQALLKREATNAPSAVASAATTNPADIAPELAADTFTPADGDLAARFYNTLTPFGTWLDTPHRGWCWQPDVAADNPTWQPYCDNGCWVWTNQGWYWHSYYSWGWAPFHYGRWFRDPHHGWLWHPDDIWGPAWVCWRDYPGYCGWAPLPPGARYTASVGWSFNGRAVGFNFGFDLGPNCYTFCDYNDFCDAHPFAHFRHDRDDENFFRHSRVDNDLTLDAQHRFFNHGIALWRIEAATHHPIRPSEARELFYRAKFHRRLRESDHTDRDRPHWMSDASKREQFEWHDHFHHVTPSADSWRHEHTMQRVSHEHAGDDLGQPHRTAENRDHSSRPRIKSHHQGEHDFHFFPHRARIEHSQTLHFPAEHHFHRKTSAGHRTVRFRQALTARHVRHLQQAPTHHSTQSARLSTSRNMHSAPTFHNGANDHHQREHSHHERDGSEGRHNDGRRHH